MKYFEQESLLGILKGESNDLNKRTYFFPESNQVKIKFNYVKRHLFFRNETPRYDTLSITHVYVPIYLIYFRSQTIVFSY